MSTSSVNNGSQANSEVAAVVPHVHFAEEAVTVREASSSNPDGRCRRRDQRATRRFQRATSIEVEFSSEFTVSVSFLCCSTCSDGVLHNSFGPINVLNNAYWQHYHCNSACNILEIQKWLSTQVSLAYKPGQMGKPWKY